MTALLEWDGCLNVRDLGGIPLAGGRRDALGALVRADNVGRLTDAGWRGARRARRYADRRPPLPEELAEDPPRDVTIEVVHVSLVGELDPNFHRGHRET